MVNTLQILNQMKKFAMPPVALSISNLIKLIRKNPQYTRIVTATLRSIRPYASIDTIIKYVIQWVIDHPEEVAAMIKLLILLITSLMSKSRSQKRVKKT